MQIKRGVIILVILLLVPLINSKQTLNSVQEIIQSSCNDNTLLGKCNQEGSICRGRYNLLDLDKAEGISTLERNKEYLFYAIPSENCSSYRLELDKRMIPLQKTGTRGIVAQFVSSGENEIKNSERESLCEKSKEFSEERTYIASINLNKINYKAYKCKDIEILRIGAGAEICEQDTTLCKAKCMTNKRNLKDISTSFKEFSEGEYHLSTTKIKINIPPRFPTSPSQGTKLEFSIPVVDGKAAIYISGSVNQIKVSGAN